MVTLITPTGDRPLAIERSIYYLERQTYDGPLQWIVADDGNVKIDYTNKKVTPLIVKGNYPGNKALSFTGNLLRAISLVQYGNILIWEDDDWYSPVYIERTLERLRDVLITGEPEAVYYNVAKQRYRVNGNTKRSSLCQTAFKIDLLPKLKKYCENNRKSAFVDDRLWRHVRENHLPYKMFADGRLCIGIKGMPGRPGIGIGHRPGDSFKPDPEWNMLRKWIGNDVDWYIDIKKKGLI